MARDFHFTIFKSKKDIEMEDKMYTGWAFPYGEEQKNNLVELIKGVFPDDDQQFRLVQFLTCREIFEDARSDTGSEQGAIERMLTRSRLYKNFIKKKERAVFVALVLANDSVGEDGVYPSVGLVMAKAAELTRLSEALK